jgi:hypothetical protein
LINKRTIRSRGAVFIDLQPDPASCGAGAAAVAVLAAGLIAERGYHRPLRVTTSRTRAAFSGPSPGRAAFTDFEMLEGPGLPCGAGRNGFMLNKPGADISRPPGDP